MEARVGEDSRNDERSRHMIYDPSIGLAVGWGEPTEAEKKESDEDAIARRRQALAISGGWVFLTGESPDPSSKK